jgi:aryl-alcohol dehydrogenase-like predicted oxidoreductase
MLQRAHQMGMGVIIKEALANGRLTPRNQAPTFAPQLAKLNAIADRHATSIDAVALAAALAQPWVGVVLSGAATAEQLQSNLGALNVALTPADWDELSEIAESPQAYWSTRSRLAWN